MDELSRRDFLKVTAGTAGIISLAGLGCAGAGGKPALSAATLAKPRPIGANDRINFGVIGVGGMGSGHLKGLVNAGDALNVRVLAVSDLFQKRITRAKEICKGDGEMDYRRILERKDIDAVLIATADHWHGKIAVDALQAGKHVYVEKPMTHTIEQAIELREMVRRTGNVLQVGPGATAEDSYWKANTAIKQGRIGKVGRAIGSYNRNARECLYNVHQKIDPEGSPFATGENYVNWEMFLGTEWGLAPQREWTPVHFYQFRKFWPYSGGVATDLLYHKLAPLLIAIEGPDGAYPHRVSAGGGLYLLKDGRDIPDNFFMTADYPGEYTIQLTSSLTNDDNLPTRIYGRHGIMDVDGQLTLKANGDFVDEFKAANGGETETSIIRESRTSLLVNFLDVIRGKAPAVHCNVELGCATVVAIEMAVASYRENRVMLWDAEKERVIAG